MIKQFRIMADGIVLGESIIVQTEDGGFNNCWCINLANMSRAIGELSGPEAFALCNLLMYGASTRVDLTSMSDNMKNALIAFNAPLGPSKCVVETAYDGTTAIITTQSAAD